MLPSWTVKISFLPSHFPQNLHDAGVCHQYDGRQVYVEGRKGEGGVLKLWSHLESFSDGGHYFAAAVHVCHCVLTVNNQGVVTIGNAVLIHHAPRLVAIHTTGLVRHFIDDQVINRFIHHCYSVPDALLLI